MSLKGGEVIKTFSGHRYGTLSGRDIITVYVFPPIPMRDQDWAAYHDGDDEMPYRYGWGATEQAALADLRRIDQERYEYEHELNQTLDERQTDND